MRLLIVEDSTDLAELVTARLQRSGLAADVANSAADARIMMATRSYAAVILDLGLPDEDGLGIVRDIRNRGNSVPILILTARGRIEDRVQGLDAGADDYLVKPFAQDELVARVQALLRRPDAMLGRRLRAGNVVFDSVSREVLIDNKRPDLSAREGEVLELLMRRAGRIVPKQHIEDHLYGADELGSNAVEVYIHRLRKRFEDHSAGVAIHTVRGVGYVLEETAK